ncbi:MAG: Uncharacterised protein [Synechococcus sp. MIT S9220]|nr:MAG: Uncharacterised protein [Synechococcus sp. MIT S9220]
MAVCRVKAVDADAVATMFPAGAVHVAALSEMDADMGAALRGAEENQIASAQSRYIVRLHCQRLAEPFLLIGISWQPDPSVRESGLHKSGAVQIGPDGATPEVGVIDRGRGPQPLEHRRQSGGDLRVGEQTGVPVFKGHSLFCQFIQGQPAGVAVFQKHSLHSSVILGSQGCRDPEAATGCGLGRESVAHCTGVAVLSTQQFPAAPWGDQVHGDRGA